MNMVKTNAQERVRAQVKRLGAIEARMEHAITLWKPDFASDMVQEYENAYYNTQTEATRSRFERGRIIHAAILEYYQDDGREAI